MSPEQSDDHVFTGAEYVISGEEQFAFGIESVLMRKHVMPDSNALVTGALLWDNENKKKYFLTSKELDARQVSKKVDAAE